MKKLLSLALCALMIFSAAATVFAAEENVYAIDFEAQALGSAAQSIDTHALYNNPDAGEIDIVQFDGDKALRINKTELGTKYGCYSQLLYNNANGVAKWGAEDQFVVEYDVYLETTHENMIFTLGTMSCAGTSGTAWIEPFLIKGMDLGVYVNGVKEPVKNLKLKTWYKIAVAFDMEKKVSALYIDGVKIAKDVAFNAAITSNLVRFVRLAYAKSNVGAYSCYLDNIKVYNAKQPRVIKEASAPQTFDAAVVLAVVSVVSASGVIVSKKRK